MMPYRLRCQCMMARWVALPEAIGKDAAERQIAETTRFTWPHASPCWLITAPSISLFQLLFQLRFVTQACRPRTQ